LASKPELIERWNIPYRIWNELSGSRRYTAAGPAGIPFSEFFAWALMNGYTREEMRNMWEDVHLLDRTYLNVVPKFTKDSGSTGKKA